jgi:hypothetical protein
MALASHPWGERLRRPCRSMVESRLPKWMVPPGVRPTPVGLLPLATKESFSEGTIRTSIGKARCNSTFRCANCWCFCIGKIQGGQDCMFLFRDGLVNYKTHYDLPSFRPLLGGNSTTSNGLILTMNSGYNGASRELEKGGNNLVPPYLKDNGPFIDREAVGLL